MDGQKTKFNQFDALFGWNDFCNDYFLQKNMFSKLVKIGKSSLLSPNAWLSQTSNALNLILLLTPSVILLSFLKCRNWIKFIIDLVHVTYVINWNGVIDKMPCNMEHLFQCTTQMFK